MIVLFETSAGYALFKVLDTNILKDVSSIQSNFSDISSAQKVVKLKKFKKFENTQEAVKCSTALIESKLPDTLKNFLKESIAKEKEELAVYDKILGGVIKQKLGINCIYNESIFQLLTGIRQQINSLLSEYSTEKDIQNMSLGLSHSLSRYKLKFSPDKVDTMIVQAINLLEDVDKEINIYSMRVKEWYGWTYPELAKMIPDNLIYAKVAKIIGNRNSINVDESADFEEKNESSHKKKIEELLKNVLPNEEMVKEVIDGALVSMGSEISEIDLIHVMQLCDEVIELNDYKEKLNEYLKNRMLAIAPNLTFLVGEKVGAKLISHAGSLLNLAKQPGSTIQILGAEKSLFRALKSNHNTPKYGLIYHAALITQTPQQYKGRIARVLAAKCAISCRVDALGEKETVTIGEISKEKVEKRIATLEKAQGFIKQSGNNKQIKKIDPSKKYTKTENEDKKKFDDKLDVSEKKDDKKRKREDVNKKNDDVEISE